MSEFFMVSFPKAVVIMILTSSPFFIDVQKVIIQTLTILLMSIDLTRSKL